MEKTHLQAVADGTPTAAEANLLYTAAGVWLARDASTGIVRLGVADRRQGADGPVLFVDLPERGMALEAGDEVADVETEAADLSLATPFAGTVIAINEQLASTPTLVDEDPYGEGWLIEVRPADWPVEGLLDEQAYLMSMEIGD